MKTSYRSLALDVLRGMTIALMILVNTPGSWKYVYSPLRHADWHGCTPTDLVFPFFLFVVGASLFLSISGNRLTLSRAALWRVGRRALIIFALGLFINSYPQWISDYASLRIMGVLQRIALAYALAALIVLSAPGKWLPGIGAFILLAYWGILIFFGSPDPYSLRGNAAVFFDRALLGENHLYQGFGIPFDPEGILSTLPAAVTVLAGYLAQRMIHQAKDLRPVGLLAAYGILFTLLGYVWGLFFPLNKPLWTSSYVLYTAGLAGLLYAALIYITDFKGYKKWALAFSVFGMNPLLLFVLSVIWGKTLRMLIHIPTTDGKEISASAWAFLHIFVPLAGPAEGSLLFAMAHIALFWLIGYILFRCRIFVKV